MGGLVAEGLGNSGLGMRNNSTTAEIQGGVVIYISQPSPDPSVLSPSLHFILLKIIFPSEKPYEGRAHVFTEELDNLAKTHS